MANHKQHQHHDDHNHQHHHRHEQVHGSKPQVGKNIIAPPQSFRRKNRGRG